MKRPWSISTTVRNPERLRDFLLVLKKLEGQKFNKDNQIKYQILLIQEKIYKPLNIPQKFRKYYEVPEVQMPYKVAKEIFFAQKYEDPPMRGRQSVNPLNKLGFAIAREGIGPIKITELGNKFLAGDYDIGFIFFKSLLKLQFPNPWSADFSEKEGFNILPLIATMHLIYKLNSNSDKKGLDRTEFSLFIPTFINASKMDEQVKRILEFRKSKDKKEYIKIFAKKFYGGSVEVKKVNNLFDYGDNIMRYFRLTRYFKVTTDPLGYRWNINLESFRSAEIEQLLKMYDGSAIRFKTLRDYLKHLSDITKPELPWEKLENLRQIAISLRNAISKFLDKEKVNLIPKENALLEKDISTFSKTKLEAYISNLRLLNLDLKLRIEKAKIVGDTHRLKEIIEILKNPKELRQYQPEQFEKLIVEALKIIDDELLIKANYPVDDNGEPINFAPGNKADIEAYYEVFNSICEVTLNTTRLQWVQEGQPVMRHLRDFEKLNTDKEAICLFIAPDIHKDTYSTFWIAVKHGYDGVVQQIVPMTTDQFALVLERLLEIIKQNKRFLHKDLYKLYRQIIEGKEQCTGFSEWSIYISKIIQNLDKILIT